MQMIAALFVLEDGPYAGIPDVDVWGITRDARLYSGPYPVVAHPPCERWGRYWNGGPSAKVRRLKGDDGGCFKSALESVNRFHGVLEHPKDSHAFAAFGLTKPPRHGGWVKSGIGMTCCVEQGHYGHLARKATWLYYVGVAPPPELIWGASNKTGLVDCGGRPERRQFVIPKRMRAVTPVPFRDVLLDIARNCQIHPAPDDHLHRSSGKS